MGERERERERELKTWQSWRQGEKEGEEKKKRPIERDFHKNKMFYGGK